MPCHVPPRFRKGYEAVRSLESHPRYQAAFIFGSAAEGTADAKSDLDVKVIVREDSPCQNINHPTFDDYKLDITFRSFRQIEEFIENEIKAGEREPNLARGLIIFDKTGELARLQQRAQIAAPKRYTEEDYQFVQFLLYHANDKVERFISDNPSAALYSMHANIGEILKIHFKLHGHWLVSSKNVLRNLETRDAELADLVKSFVATAQVNEKFSYWSQIIDHVAKPMGGRQPIAENNCDCCVCAGDLAALAGVNGG